MHENVNYFCDQWEYEPLRKNHTYVIQAGAKAYTCDLCVKPFTVSGSFTRHKQIQSRAKAYICDMCVKLFTVLGSFTRHKRIQSGAKAYMWLVC